MLPTPTTQGNEFSPSMQKWPGHRALMALVEGLPTPTAKIYGYNQGGRAGRVGKKRPSVDKIADEVCGGSRLALREWMMGWPVGWSALEPLAMDRFRLWLRLHGGC